MSRYVTLCNAQWRLVTGVTKVVTLEKVIKCHKRTDYCNESSY
jgi:hypothetical protein